MRVNLANKFLILGVLLYVAAGIAFISNMNYDIVILLASIVFLALGFFMHIRDKWFRLFKKRM